MIDLYSRGSFTLYNNMYIAYACSCPKSILYTCIWHSIYDIDICIRFLMLQKIAYCDEVVKHMHSLC